MHVRFFGLCARVDLDTETGCSAGRFAQRYRKAFMSSSLQDFLLAAAAQRHSCPLWTANCKHFPTDDIELFAGGHRGEHTPPDTAR